MGRKRFTPKDTVGYLGIGNLNAIFGQWETYRRGRGLAIPPCRGLHMRGEAATRARVALIHPLGTGYSQEIRLRRER